jgi:hypothetical protein
MKQILPLIIISAMMTQAAFSQEAAVPEKSQPIIVAAEGQPQAQGPQSTAAVRTVTTKKAYTHTETIPETTTTIQTPDRVLVREGVLSWVSIGLRVSADYHVTQKDGALSPLWLYGEFYNTVWGIELGVGRLSQPLNTITDVTTNATVTGISGIRNYWTVETVFKYYMPFARWFWAGAGFAYNSYDNGFVYTSAAAFTPLAFMRSQFLWEGAVGIKVALGNGFNVVHFDPNIRVLGPFNTDGSSSVIVRLNLGFTYSFGL